MSDVAIEVDAEYASVLIVSLDDLPIRTSRKVLVQVVTEETNNGWQVELSDGLMKIVALGGAPLLVKNVVGQIAFRRPDAGRCKVTTLDGNGYPLKTIGTASNFSLLPDTLYYLVTP
ncbi:hypothetical protein [Fervidibacter sacchari]